jgi:hypothetical protein
MTRKIWEAEEAVPANHANKGEKTEDKLLPSPSSIPKPVGLLAFIA